MQEFIYSGINFLKKVRVYQRIYLRLHKNMSVSFRFDNLEYQRQAVNSVISLLEGQSQDANKNTQEFTKKDTNQLQDYDFIPVHSNPGLTI